MARGMSRVFLIGNLGFDPDPLRYTSTGSAVTNLRIATNESWKNKKTGERKEHTEWHRVVLYTPFAEIVHRYLKKGSRIWVEGHLRTEEWEKEGHKQYTTKIIAHHMHMLDSRHENSNTWPDTPPSTPTSETQASPSFAEDDFDDDIPF